MCIFYPDISIGTVGAIVGQLDTLACGQGHCSAAVTYDAVYAYSTRMGWASYTLDIANIYLLGEVYYVQVLTLKTFDLKY